MLSHAFLRKAQLPGLSDTRAPNFAMHSPPVITALG
jgi:hypothetical protein